MSHSPGPWRWGNNLTDRLFSYQPDVPHQESPWLSVGVNRETSLSEADARLIAAAPTMLTLLEELEWSGRYWPGHGQDEQTDLCPMEECGAKKGESHEPDCRLGRLLSELRKP
jgi:hypothetical protein